VSVSFFNLDIEPTNRCNANCYFCPRDQTPHQGLMTTETFDQALTRAIEFRELARSKFDAEMKVNLCGLGEPLLNRQTPDFVRKIRTAGFECSVSSNGALLNEVRGRALLDAGLQGIEINVGEEGEDYERLYGLPFEKTCENVIRFNEMAAADGGNCQVRVVLVDHRRDSDHIAKMKRFWRERGIKHFMPLDIMNRAGALFVDEMQYTSFPEHAEAEARLRARGAEPVCAAPFILLFIGYDGQYYLCCSDWKKEVPLGSVFDTSFLAITHQKFEHVISRDPICRTCNWDPVNRLTEELRARAAGEPGKGGSIDDFVDELIRGDTAARSVVDVLDTVEGAFAAGVVRSRRSIPVTAV
jgi:MoaA/NifB/PqqE/SkfB family radical SAM enzyme